MWQNLGVFFAYGYWGVKAYMCREIHGYVTTGDLHSRKTSFRAE